MSTLSILKNILFIIDTVHSQVAGSFKDRVSLVFLMDFSVTSFMSLLTKFYLQLNY